MRSHLANRVCELESFVLQECHLLEASPLALYVLGLPLLEKLCLLLLIQRVCLPSTFLEEVRPPLCRGKCVPFYPAES